MKIRVPSVRWRDTTKPKPTSKRSRQYRTHSIVKYRNSFFHMMDNLGFRNSYMGHLLGLISDKNTDGHTLNLLYTLKLHLKKIDRKEAS